MGAGQTRSDIVVLDKLTMHFIKKATELLLVHTKQHRTEDGVALGTQLFHVWEWLIKKEQYTRMEYPLLLNRGVLPSRTWYADYMKGDAPLGAIHKEFYESEMKYEKFGGEVHGIYLGCHLLDTELKDDDTLTLSNGAIVCTNPTLVEEQWAQWH